MTSSSPLAISAFHLIMGYLNMIGKKMEGSGFADILLEANLISSGSILGVLSGKNYSRAVRCHKVLFESLHRLLISKFVEEHGFCSVLDGIQEEKLKIIEDLEKSPSEERLETFLSDPDVMEKLRKYDEFCEVIRKGGGVKTG